MDFFKKLFSPITGTLDFIQKYFKSLVFIIIMILIFGSAPDSQLKQPNLAKIYLSGVILDSSKVLNEIERVKRDKNIKGALFIVNSPGGAVPPSIEISEGIKILNEHKPVIAYAQGSMASGGYYASIWADKIIANPGSVVGSIGAILQSANVEDLISKLGIKSQNIKAGKYKEIGTPLRKWETYEKAELEKVVNGIYNLFVSDVVKARKLDLNKSTEFADAHIFLGTQAKDVGLVDKVGTIYLAEKELIAVTGVKTAIWEEKNKFDKFLDNFIDGSFDKIFTYFIGLKTF